MKPSPPISHTRSISRILFDNLVTPFHGVMLLCALILLAAGDDLHLGFFFVTLINAAVRIGHDLSAKRAIDRLSARHRKSTPLLRGGRVRVCRANELLPGDLCRMAKGSEALADCVVVEGHAAAAEALLFGGSHRVLKDPGDTIYAGSRIESGECTARVLCPASESLCARMEREARRVRPHRTELTKGLRRVLLVLIAVALPLAAGKAFDLLHHGAAPLDAAAYAASMVASLAPPLMVLYFSLSLLLGARTLRKKSAVAHDLFCVEMLARADVICFDKTGTLTHRTPDGDVREDIEALDYFRRQGAAMKILSGDTTEAVRRVAEKTALDARVCDCRSLSDGAALARAALEFDCFSYAGAQQKADIVQSLRAAGHTVAMVGDGVNDVAAFYAADCSVSFGSGAVEARAAAQIVLRENTVAALPEIALEGRRVINNITRTGELFVKKSLCSFVLYLLVLLADLPYPMKSIHWTVVGLCCVTIPAAVLTMEHQHQPLLGHFVHNVFFEAVPGALLHIVYLLAAIGLSALLGLSDSLGLTLCCGAAAAAGLSVLWHVCLPLDRLRAWLCCLMTALLPLLLALLHEPLGLSVPTPAVTGLLVVLSAAGYPILCGCAALTTRVEHALAMRRLAGKLQAAHAESGIESGQVL